MEMVSPAVPSSSDWSERLTEIERRLVAQEKWTLQLAAGLEAANKRIAQKEELIEEVALEARQCDLVERKGKTYDVDTIAIENQANSAKVEMPAEAEQSRALTYREAEQIYVESEEYSLSESAWEAGFFIFTPAAGSLGSVFVLVAIIINIICQLTFCVIAWTAFANPETSTFNNRDVIEQAKSWRLTDGHSPDRMDKASWVSLATRVCAQDNSLVFSTAQAGLLEEAAGYQGGFGTDIFPFLNILGSEGSILTTACLVLWYFTASREIFDCINVLNAICMIPNSGMCSRMLVNIDDMFVIDGLGWPRRLSLLLISFIRLGLTIWILIAGGIWLCFTSSLFDLILNAAALSFVFDLDECLFATLCPPMIKGAISRTTPLKLKPETSIRGLGFKGPVALMVSFVFIYLLFENGVESMISKMQEVESVMCDGPTDFVVEAGAGLGHAVAVKTKPHKGGAEIDTLLKSATNQILRTNIGEDDWNLLARQPVQQQGLIAEVVETEAEFKSALGKTSDDFVAPACIDELHPAGDDLVVRAYLEVLRFRTQQFNATRCSDFEKFCRSLTGTGTLVRSFCSSTCKCFTLMGALVDRSGCSYPCTSMIKVELSSHGSYFSSCNDMTQDVYGSNEVAVWLKNLETMIGANIPIESITRDGCRVVSALLANNYFEPDDLAWVPDALCGRSMGSNIAADNIQYTTLRWMCPVTCGCTLDFSAECPRSCKRGPYSQAVDTCSLGVCPFRTIANFQVIPGIFCKQVDMYMKNGDPSFLPGITVNSTPARCEMITVLFSEACCCPGPCEPYAFCFINTQCGWCNASDACKGTPCAICEEVGPCSSCFKSEENDGSGGSDGGAGGNV